jgi:hypothetical protein
MPLPRKYLIHFVDGTEVETSWCHLQTSIENTYLFEKDPSQYGKGILRTFVMANIRYWEAID